MIRGAQKKVVAVRISDSPIFDEAYFVMKKGREASGGDMAREAGRIIESLEIADKPARLSNGRLARISLLVCGAGSGALITAIFWGIASIMGG